MSKTQDPTARTVSPAWHVAGGLALLVSIVASFVLVISHFGGMAIPGCGVGGGCAAITSGPWGKVPGLGLPISFIGLGYFVAAMVGWVAARGCGVTAAFLWLIRLGALASLFFMVVMAVLWKTQGHFCPYCTAAHVGNLAFWIIAERTARSPIPRLAQPAMVAAVFVVAVVSLFVTDLVRASQIEASEERQLAESIDQITGGGGEEQPPSADEPFTGRYLLGPEKAAIRIVALSDYQCPDCKNIETQVRHLMDTRNDVSFSAKHFPMCSDCNPRMNNANPHPNACWAARAAEAAGILRGAEGFYEMHFLLFDREGSFTDAELNQILQSLGYDVAEFLRVMQSEQTLKLVQQDIAEGVALGLHYTPMVFINGVELKGFRPRGALIKAVNQVARTNPEPKTAAADHPPMAAEKYVDDWRSGVRFSVIPPAGQSWTRGSAEPRAQVVIFGDLTSRFTRDLDAEIRRVMAGRDDVQYMVLHYPLSQSCNRYSKLDNSPMGCAAALAAEAAGMLGGAEGFWAMFDWIMANQSGLSEQRLVQAAVDLGMERAAFVEAMGSAEARDAVAEDTRTALGMGVGRFIPATFVNQRFVPRWRLDGADVLGSIVEEAAAEGMPVGGRP